jgi:hypothetical protein
MTSLLTKAAEYLSSDSATKILVTAAKCSAAIAATSTLIFGGIGFIIGVKEVIASDDPKVYQSIIPVKATLNGLCYGLVFGVTFPISLPTCIYLAYRRLRLDHQQRDSQSNYYRLDPPMIRPSPIRAIDRVRSAISDHGMNDPNLARAIKKRINPLTRSA